MKDDEREVDWATRKIRELQAAFTEVMDALRAVDARLLTLEGYPRREPTERMAFDGTGVVRGCWYCSGEETSDSAMIAHLRSHIDDLTKPSKGAEATRRTVIELAEKRIRDYMTGHFSE